MTRYLVAALAACSLFGFAGSASAQAPTITFDAPANGVDLSTVDDIDLFNKSKVTVSGTVTDETRVNKVQYRIERSRRWRTATKISTSSTDTATSYVWSIRVNMRRGSATRVYVRAVDDDKNESDIIGRKVQRGRR